MTNAHQELRAASPEAYKLFLLCLCAGLRRGEADVCLWSQLNADDNSIRVEANQYIEPKHGSGGTVYVDPSLMKELLSFKGSEQDGFVVNSPLGWKATTYRRYRCEPHWRTLIGWLESNGISARKKGHELRKLFGDAIVKRHGIFAGSAQLRQTVFSKGFMTYPTAQRHWLRCRSPRTARTAANGHLPRYRPEVLRHRLSVPITPRRFPVQTRPSSNGFVCEPTVHLWSSKGEHSRTNNIVLQAERGFVMLCRAESSNCLRLSPKSTANSCSETREIGMPPV